MDVERIFNAALEKQSAAERAAYLDGACGHDADLRARVREVKQLKPTFSVLRSLKILRLLFEQLTNHMLFKPDVKCVF